MYRRRFLRGLGGAALATPFLSSLQSTARAQGAGPRRMVIFSTPNGCLTNRWFPKVEDGLIDAAALTGTTLEALTPWADKLLFPRGLGMFPWGTVNGYLDPHAQAMGSKLTCAPIDVAGEHYALGRSLDHLIAAKINPPDTPPLVISPQQASTNVAAILSYSAAQEPYLPESDPALILQSLTGLSSAELDHQATRRLSVIDAVRDDLGTFQRLNLSLADSQRIDDWLTLLRETERQALESGCSSETVAALGITPQAIDETSKPYAGNRGLYSRGIGERTDLLIKLIALSMVCDANRSIILQWHPAISFEWEGIAPEWGHAGLSHRSGSSDLGGTCVDNVFGMLAEIDAWFAQQYAALLGLLDKIGEGDGSLLDQSAVMWLPTLSDGLLHNVNNLPIVIAGSCGGALKQGVSVNLEGAPLGTGDSEASCDEAGNVIFMPEPDTNPGKVPLNKLYVTLLNALGVTDDGAPFNEFGQVDSNDLEAGITDPGELEALKA